MALRQLLKKDSYFLVYYHEDGKFQVRRRGLIKTHRADDEVISLLYLFPPRIFLSGSPMILGTPSRIPGLG